MHHVLVWRDPRATRDAPACAVLEIEGQPQPLAFSHGEPNLLVPGRAEDRHVRPSFAKTRHREHCHPAQADPLHRLQLGGDRLRVDPTFPPMPPALRLGIIRWMMKPFLQFLCCCWQEHRSPSLLHGACSRRSQQHGGEDDGGESVPVLHLDSSFALCLAVSGSVDWKR